AGAKGPTIVDVVDQVVRPAVPRGGAEAAGRESGVRITPQVVFQGVRPLVAQLDRDRRVEQIAEAYVVVGLRVAQQDLFHQVDLAVLVRARPIEAAESARLAV